MCYRPLHIYNNSSYIHEGYFKTQFTVPCGKCYDCRKALVSAWQVRCSEELNNCKRCFFYTLTIDNDHISKYGTNDYGYDFITFSKTSVQKWFKRFRKSLGGIKLKYMLTSELGEITHRPHYHVLLYFYDDISEYQVHKAILKTWQQGFIKKGKLGAVVLNPNAVMYVCKYMHKTDKYYNGFAYKLGRKVLFKWYKALKTVCPHIQRPPHGKLHFELVDNSCLSSEKSLWNNFYNAAIRDYNEHASFHLQSTNFGIPQDDTKYKDTECLIYDHCGGYKTTKTPLYYIRKYYYDRLPNLKDGQKTIYRIKSEGIEMFVRKFPQRLQAYQNDARNALCNYKKISESLQDVTIQSKEIDAFIDRYGLTQVVRTMSVYKYVFRDLYEPKGFALCMTPDAVLSNPTKFLRIHLHALRSNNKELIDNTDFKLNKQQYINNTHNNKIYFYVIEQLCHLCDNYICHIRKQNAEQRQIELDKIRETKSKLLQL